MLTDPISTVEAARVIGVDRSRVLQLIRRGQLAAQKIGNQYLVERSAAEQFQLIPRGRPKKIA